MTPSPNSEVVRTLVQLLGAHIETHRFQFGDETDLQDGLAEVFEPFDFEREHRIDARSRVDFLITSPAPTSARIGVEVKVAHPASKVEAQCRRYLDSGVIDGLVLVTTKRYHRKITPDRFDKPFVVVWLGSSGL